MKQDPFNIDGLRWLQTGIDGGACRMTHRGVDLFIIASWGEGWEHVSVSLPKRCPTWDEMCAVKDRFWRDDECVMQLHPPRENYINNHPNCLHLWKPSFVEIPQPPSIFVGV